MSYNIKHASIQIFNRYLLCAMQGDLEQCRNLLNEIPSKYYDRLAKFLDQIEQKEEALLLAQDDELKFELAIQLGDINQSLDIAQKQQNSNKLKQVGDAALIIGQIQLAIKCFQQSDDFGSLLLIYSSLGMKDQIEELAQKCDNSKTNIQFSCYFILGDLNNCIEVLLNQGKVAEAAIFARTYCPSRVSELTLIWKNYLQKNNHLVNSQKISDPFLYEEYAQDLQQGIEIEKYYAKTKQDVPAHQFEEYQQIMKQNLLQMIQEEGLDLESLPTQIEIQDQNPCLQEFHLNNQ